MSATPQQSALTFSATLTLAWPRILPTAGRAAQRATRSVSTAKTRSATLSAPAQNVVLAARWTVLWRHARLVTMDTTSSVPTDVEMGSPALAAQPMCAPVRTQCADAPTMRRRPLPATNAPAPRSPTARCQAAAAVGTAPCARMRVPRCPARRQATATARARLHGQSEQQQCPIQRM